MAEFSFPIRVYYEDTDAAGLVYHANYLKFFERARSEWIRAMGVEQDKLMQQNVIFAVSKIEIDYIKPARFNDELIVVSRITKCGYASMVFEQQLFRAGSEKLLLSTATVKAVNVTLSTMKPHALDEALKEEILRVI